MSRLYHRRKAEIQALTLQDWQQEDPNFDEYMYELTRQVIVENADIPGLGKVCSEHLYDTVYHGNDALDLLANLYVTLRRGDKDAQEKALQAVDRMMIGELSGLMDQHGATILEALKKEWIGALDDEY